MPTQQTQDQLDAITAQRAAISDQIARINDQYSADPSHALGGIFSQAAHRRLQAAVYPLREQERLLNRRYSEIERSDNRARIEAGRAATDETRATKAVEAQKGAQAKARKEAVSGLEDASARTFGLGPKKGIDYITQQGAFYDPARNAIAVPTGKTEKTATPKADKGDPSAIKKVGSELNNYLKGATKDSEAGPIGRVDPASFFGAGKTQPYETDDAGDRVYKYNGREIKIDGQTAKDWEDEYRGALPGPAIVAPVATPKVDYVPVEDFQKANVALNALKGTNVIDPVEAYLGRQNRARLAVPAIAAGGTPASITVPGNPLIPGAEQPFQAQERVLPSIDQSGAAALSRVPTAVREAPEVAGFSTLNQNLNPIFPAIEAKRRAAHGIVNNAVFESGGTIGKEQILAASDAADQAGITDPEQRGVFTKSFLEKSRADNQSPAFGYNAITGAGRLIAQLLQTGVEDNPINLPANAVKAGLRSGYDYLAPKVNALGEKYLFPAVDQFYRDEETKKADLAKEFLAQKATGVIGPNSTPADFEQFMMRGPSASNTAALNYD